MIVVTGATGGLGSQVFKALLGLIPPSQIAVSLYNPSGASDFIKDSGAEIRKGDYSDPASLEEAFKGADKLFIVSYPGISRETRFKNHKAALDAAKRCGVGHVYYTSLGFASGTSANSVSAVMQAHLDTEAYIKESGLKYTIIREGIYNESWPLYLGFWSPEEGDEAYVPGDGPIAWVSRADLGEATAKIIVEGAYPNETILLSGSRTITLSQLAKDIGTLLSRPLTLKIVPEDDYVSRNTGKRGPRGDPAFLRQWALTYKALESGECAFVDPTIQKVLGRELKPMEETLKEMLTDKGEAVERYAK